MSKLSSVLLKMLGWKVDNKLSIPNKTVLCIAPHTSNFDLPLGLIAYNSLGYKASFLMKKDWFFFPMGCIFKALGGIPVDRSKKNSLTDQIAEIFKNREKFQLAITPEGTRKANGEWKLGFYFIAQKAHVPITIISFDYATKIIRVHDIFTPTGDVDKDLEYIKSFYKDVQGKHPEKFKM